MLKWRHRLIGCASVSRYCVLRYTPEQMYNVVASVDQYQHFVPWCKKSRVAKRRNGDVQAELEIGFPPIVERYTSEVTVVPNHKVRVSPLKPVAPEMKHCRE